MGAQRTSHEKCASFQDQSHTLIRSLYLRERAVVPLVRPQMPSFEDREGPCELYVQSPRTVPAAENDSPIQIILTETAIYATSSYILSSHTRGLVFMRAATYLKVKNTWNAKVVAKRWSPNRSFVPSPPKFTSAHCFSIRGITTFGFHISSPLAYAANGSKLVPWRGAGYLGHESIVTNWVLAPHRCKSFGHLIG